MIDEEGFGGDKLLDSSSFLVAVGPFDGCSCIRRRGRGFGSTSGRRDLGRFWWFRTAPTSSTLFAQTSSTQRSASSSIVVAAIQS